MPATTHVKTETLVTKTDRLKDGWVVKVKAGLREGTEKNDINVK